MGNLFWIAYLKTVFQGRVRDKAPASSEMRTEKGNLATCQVALGVLAVNHGGIIDVHAHSVRQVNASFGHSLISPTKSVLLCLTFFDSLWLMPQQAVTHLRGRAVAVHRTVAVAQRSDLKPLARRHPRP